MDRDWTSPDLLEERLVETFRNNQGCAIYSPRHGTFQPVLGQRLRGYELIALTSRFLPRDSFERIALLTRARARAGGPTVSAICRECGWKRRSFDEAADRGALKVADGIRATIRVLRGD